MWIRSQDKTILIRGDSFIIRKPNKRHKYYGIIIVTSDSDYYLMAEYSSEAQAIKVLDMIENFMSERHVKNVLYLPPAKNVLSLPPDNEV